MAGYPAVTWLLIRRHSVPAFVRHMAATRAPEFAKRVLWVDVLTMAQREGIQVRVVKLPNWQRARLVRLGQHVFIQVNRAMSRAEQTVHAVHELVHFWRDDPGLACYYSDGGRGDNEEFADIVAWLVTSPAREFVDQLPEREK